MTLTLADWHDRFLQQARWTDSLRSHLFERAGIDRARRILEVGCGTGAVTESAARSHPETLVCGVEIDLARLGFARACGARSAYLGGDALRLPFRDGAFGLVFCHYFLMWVRESAQALREMVRVTRSGGWVAAMAEPDHDARIDHPAELTAFGRRQTEALRRQGADTAAGRRLAELFCDAGIRLLECGVMASAALPDAGGEKAAESELRILREDLQGEVAEEEWQAFRTAERSARENGRRVLHIPTFYAAGIRE
ncbi:MAG: methyltransferase domain-containing protein [Anaerolineales bacterium]|nr:methyltransferase domain-containing protein [Anaerolineales bacterium]